MRLLSRLRYCWQLMALPVKKLVLLVRGLVRRTVSTARRVQEKQNPRWKELHPQSRVLEDPPGEAAQLLPLQARWLARVLVASRPLGP